MTDTPTLKRSAYHVWVAPDGVDPDTAADDELEYHHVVVHHQDQLRAELEASKHGLDPRRHPMHLVALWLWANLTRTERFTGKFQEFKVRLVNYDTDRDRPEPHDDPDAELDDLDARPTEARSN